MTAGTDPEMCPDRGIAAEDQPNTLTITICDRI